MAKLNFRSDDHAPEDGVWLSFNEWKAKDFGVIKGEKARRYVNGLAVFHESQVMPMTDFDIYKEIAEGCGGGFEWWKD